MPAPETTAPPRCRSSHSPTVAAAHPVQGAPTVDRSNAIPTWRNSVVTLLGTQQALIRRMRETHRGIAQIAFSIDRNGRVISSQVVTASGSRGA